MSPPGTCRFFIADMKRHRREGPKRFGAVKPADLRKVMGLIRQGRRTDHPRYRRRRAGGEGSSWARREPSERALQLAFYQAQLTISSATACSRAMN